jgi:hypothetical protein
MSRTKEWDVHLYLSEEEGATRVTAVLDDGSEAVVTGHGTARCKPTDVDVPEIGDEIAVSRALSNLGGTLMRTADRDLEGIGAGPSHLAERRRGPDESQ